FAFVRPAQFCAPSAAGLALVCGFTEPHQPADEADILWRVIDVLCTELKAAPLGFRLVARSGAKLMAAQNWPWVPLVEAGLDATDVPPDYVPPPPLEVWTLFEEWEEQPPEGAPRSVSLSEDEVRAALERDLSRAGLDERRPQQVEFALKAKDIFAPKW